MSDDAAELATPLTIIDQQRAGISGERSQRLGRGGVVPDGEIVATQDHPAARPTKWRLVSS